MAEVKQPKKDRSGGNFRAQSAITIGRNKRLKGERHAKRMAAQMSRDPFSTTAPTPKVPRGTARALRRKPMALAYAAAH